MPTIKSSSAKSSRVYTVHFVDGPLNGRSQLVPISKAGTINPRFINKSAWEIKQLVRPAKRNPFKDPLNCYPKQQLRKINGFYVCPDYDVQKVSAGETRHYHYRPNYRPNRDPFFNLHPELKPTSK